MEHSKVCLLAILLLWCNPLVSCSSERSDIIDPNSLPKDTDNPPDSAYPSTTLTISNHSEWTKNHYHERIKEFKEKPLRKGDIVMVGNSLTEQGELWSEKFDNAKVRNRGIAGDTSDGVLERLGEVNWSQPAVVFLLIGTNDLWTANTSEKTFENITSITEKITKESPDTKIYVQSIFPVQNQPKINEKVKEINQLLKTNQNSAKYELIDTYSLLVDDSGSLTAEYTHDGVHLTNKGYDVWVDLLNDFINKN